MFHQRAESLRLNGLEPARRFFAGLLAECDPRREHLWVAHVDEQKKGHGGDVTVVSAPGRGSTSTTCS